MSIAEKTDSSYNGKSKIETGRGRVSYDSGLEKAVIEALDKIKYESILSQPYFYKESQGEAVGEMAGASAVGGAPVYGLPRVLDWIESNPSPEVEAIGVLSILAYADLGAATMEDFGEIRKKMVKHHREKYERKKTKIKESVEEVPKKLEELKNYLHEQFASLPKIREDIRIPDVKAREIEKELVKGYNAYNNGVSNKVPLLKEKGNKMKVVYKTL